MPQDKTICETCGNWCDVDSDGEPHNHACPEPPKPAHPVRSHRKANNMEAYAYVNAHGIVDINTVSRTQRAAMVNAIVTLSSGRVVPLNHHTEVDIEDMFTSVVGGQGGTIKRVDVLVPPNPTVPQGNPAAQPHHMRPADVLAEVLARTPRVAYEALGEMYALTKKGKTATYDEGTGTFQIETTQG